MNFKPDLLAIKVKYLKQKLLPEYLIEAVCLLFKDMQNFKTIKSWILKKYLKIK